MTPTLVHRYSWPIRDAIEHLLGEDAGDAQAWLIRVDGDELVIDIVIGDIAPAPGASVVHIEDERLRRAGVDQAFIEDGSPAENLDEENFAAADASEETAKINMEAPAADAEPEKPPRKGGPLAQRAAISCGEKGFWTFIGKKFGVTIGSADEAAAWLKAQCGIKSRIDLDYDEAKADNFREIDKSYRLWLEGYD